MTDHSKCPSCGDYARLTKAGRFYKHPPLAGYKLPRKDDGSCGASGLTTEDAEGLCSGLASDEDRVWASAAATAEVADLLALPVTIAEGGRGVLEVVAVYLGCCAAPEDETDESLEALVDEAVSQRVEKAMTVWRFFHPKAKKPGAPGEEWRRLYEDPEWSRGRCWWQEGELTEINPFHWTPLLDPAEALFEPRLELPPHGVTQASIAEQGVIVPLVITLDGDRLVILDGLQRMRAVRAVNRERLEEWAKKGRPSTPADKLRSGPGGPLIQRVPIRAILGEGQYPALGAANEVRQPADAMTRALRMEQLVTRGGLSVREAAATLGLKERMGTYLLALNKLVPQIQRKVRKGTVPGKLARVLCQIAEPELQLRALAATQEIPANQAVAGLRAALADDGMCAAVRGGAEFALPAEAEPGSITTCKITGDWFLVEKGCETISRGGRRFYVAPGALETETAKPADRLRRALDEKAGGTPRDRRLAEAILSALDGGPVPEDLAWLLGKKAKAGRKAVAEPRQIDVEDYAAGATA